MLFKPRYLTDLIFNFLYQVHTKMIEVSDFSFYCLSQMVVRVLPKGAIPATFFTTMQKGYGADLSSFPSRTFIC